MRRFITFKRLLQNYSLIYISVRELSIMCVRRSTKSISEASKYLVKD